LSRVLGWVDASLKVMQETRWQAVGYEPGADGVSPDLAKPLHVLRNPNAKLNGQLSAYTAEVQGALEVLVSSVEQQQRQYQAKQSQQHNADVAATLEPLTTAASALGHENTTSGMEGGVVVEGTAVNESGGEGGEGGGEEGGGAGGSDGAGGLGSMPRLARAGSSAGADIDALLTAAIGNGDMTTDGTLTWPGGGGLMRGLSSNLARGMSDVATGQSGTADV
jgi:hypothetical protein